jgi:Predicted integral membrane protein (DUF2269)
MRGDPLTRLTVTLDRAALVVRGDDPVLLLADETPRTPHRTDDAKFAVAADDGAPLRCDGGVMKRLSPSLRRAVLSVHIVASVGLLGTCAALVALNVRAATTADATLAAATYELLTMFSLLFGIPLSFASLASGLALGLGSKWGVLRYRWVTAKLLLNVSVIVAGAVVLGPQTAAMVDGAGGSEVALVLGNIYDVLALGLATSLSVYKPGRARQRSGGLARRASPSA